MSKVFRISAASVFALFLFRCAVQPPAEPRPRITYRTPYIRVGILWGVKSVGFSTDDAFQIRSQDGTFIARGLKGMQWRAEVVSSRPGKTIYLLVAASMSNRHNAESYVETLKKMGFDAFIGTIGRKLKLSGKEINDNRLFRVYLNRMFESEEAAERYRDDLKNRLITFVVRRKVNKASGTIRLKNLTNSQEFESTKPLMIRDGSVTLNDVPVGVGYHWERKETRRYPETIVFQVDGDGMLTVTNVLAIETYLQGVIPSEMHEGFPIEALKAQAIASRSEILAKLGISHQADPFDVCADVHCQVYSGLSKRSETTDQAVRETRGLVLSHKGKVCSAVYSAVCGGHTENNENAWGGEAKQYLEGRYDGPDRLRLYGDLSEEKNVKRWIDRTPDAYCNTKRDDALPALEYTKKYFRWEVRYSQAELRETIEKNTGRSVGAILNIKPMARGKSGRILKLTVEGKTGDIILQGELEIRKALSPNTLWSSCFYTVKRGWTAGAPDEFLIKGAGWGHGVGMCQTGAAILALNGSRFDHILRHYYKGAQIRRLY